MAISASHWYFFACVNTSTNSLLLQWWHGFVTLSASGAIHVGILHAKSVVFLLHGIVRRGGVCIRQLSLRGLLLSQRKGSHNQLFEKDLTY